VACIDVRKIAASASGNTNFSPDFRSVVKNEGRATPFSGLDGAHHARCACPDDDNIFFNHIF
jgi:hypothetical protein